MDVRINRFIVSAVKEYPYGCAPSAVGGPTQITRLVVGANDPRQQKRMVGKIMKVNCSPWLQAGARGLHPGSQRRNGVTTQEPRFRAPAVIHRAGRKYFGRDALTRQLPRWKAPLCTCAVTPLRYGELSDRWGLDQRCSRASSVAEQRGRWRRPRLASCSVGKRPVRGARDSRMSGALRLLLLDRHSTFDRRSAGQVPPRRTSRAVATCGRIGHSQPSAQ